MVAATRTHARTGWKSTQPKTREPKKLLTKKPRWKRKAQQRKSVAICSFHEVMSPLWGDVGCVSRTVDFAWRQQQAGPVVPAVEAVQIGERTRGTLIVNLADCQSRDLTKMPDQTSNDRSMRRASQ